MRRRRDGARARLRAPTTPRSARSSTARPIRGGPAEGARWSAVRPARPGSGSPAPTRADYVRSDGRRTSRARGWLDRVFDYTSDEPADAAARRGARARRRCCIAPAPAMPRLVTHELDRARSPAPSTSGARWSTSLDDKPGNSSSPAARRLRPRCRGERCGGTSRV